MNNQPENAPGLTMTRTEAEEAMTAINFALESARANIGFIRRKKWLESEEAMACARYVQQEERLKKLREKIGTAFNLGGY